MRVPRISLSLGVMSPPPVAVREHRRPARTRHATTHRPVAQRTATIRRAMRQRRLPAVIAALPLREAREVPQPAVVAPVGTQRTHVSEAELRGRVWALALPAIGEQLLALGVGVSDTFLAGHLSAHATSVVGYGQATALAAVGVAATAVWVVLNAFFAVNIGVTALVARATGARDRKLASRAAGQGVLLGAAAGLLMLVLAVPLAEVITHALGVSGQVAQLAATYIRVFSLALPATGIASASTAAMRGAGDARRPLIVMVVVNGANIVGSWMLMNGFEPLGLHPIGVIGSAIGAATGWALGAVLAFSLLWRSHPRAPKLAWPSLRPHRDTAVRILRVGLPSAAEIGVFQFGIVAFGRVIVGLGATAYAANTTINTVESLGTLPGFGFAVATTALVGQALGASDPDLAARVVWAAIRPCVAVMGTIGLIALVLPHVMLGLFVADSSVLSAGDVAMRLSCLTLPASAVAFIFNGALRGSGDTKFPVIVRATGTWGLRVPLAMVLIPFLALPGARIAMVLDFCTQAGLSYWRFRSGRWRRARV